MSKIMSAAVAVARIADDSNVAIGGFVGIGLAEHWVIGGAPASGMDFGAASNHSALID